MTGIDKQTSKQKIDRLVSSYDYELPQEQIAQTPLSQRDGSKLLVVDSPTHHSHHIFRELPELLQPGDLLILNNTRVIPARLYGRKSTGVPVEILLLEERPHQGQQQGQQQGQHQSWLALVKPGRRLKPGAEIWFTPSSELGLNDSSVSKQLTTPLPPLKATVLATDEATSGRILQFDFPEGVSWETLLELYGQVPLPPYIQDSQATPDQYQTIYAQKNGAVAAPTAGLHFTNELMENCRQRGIRLGYITLHVGVGTFRPVEVEDITEHDMHGEWLEVPQSTVEQIQETKATGGRVIAVGTTVVRALEGAVVDGELQPYCGKTNLFIYPGYQWQVVEGLITNFHLPRSSLLMLVSAMVGRERLLSLYQNAIALSYRFYSFGDAMLIFPEAKDIALRPGNRE